MVIVHEKFQMRIIEEIIKGSDGHTGGAVV